MNEFDQTPHQRPPLIKSRILFLPTDLFFPLSLDSVTARLQRPRSAGLNPNLKENVNTLRNLSAMRLMQSVPGVKQALQENKITLTTAAHVARHRCQYQDPKTEHRCTATRGLQIDHIHPFALGGTNSSDNLQILCATHNRLKVPPVYRHGSNKTSAPMGR